MSVRWNFLSNEKEKFLQTPRCGGYVGYGRSSTSANYIPLSLLRAFGECLGIWGYFCRAAQNLQIHIMKAGQQNPF